jgi:hypothetical protein
MRLILNGDRVRLATLAACLLASLALYLALGVVLANLPSGWDGYAGFSIPSAAMFRAQFGMPTVSLSAASFERALAGLLVGLWAVWGIAALTLRGASVAARRRARWIVLAGAAALLLLVVLWVPPVLSSDLYRQATYGRMVARGLNPYSTPVSAIGADQLRGLANYTQATTAYGAAYTWLSALAVAVSPSSSLAAALTWKAMSALFAFGCAALAPTVARSLGDDDGQDAQLWLGWSPLIIVEAAASGHIESIMMLPALAGILLFLRRRPVLGVLALVVSTLTKWVTGVLLLLVAMREVHTAPPGRGLRTGLNLAGAGALLTALLYAPFVGGLAGSSGIHDIALHGAAGWGAPDRDWVPQWMRMLGFAVLTIGVARFATRGGWPRLVGATVALLLVFIILVVPWLFPWYFVAPVTLAAVLPRGRPGFSLRFVSTGLAMGVMLYYAKLVVPR